MHMHCWNLRLVSANCVCSLMTVTLGCVAHTLQQTRLGAQRSTSKGERQIKLRGQWPHSPPTLPAVSGLGPPSTLRVRSELRCHVSRPLPGLFAIFSRITAVGARQQLQGSGPAQGREVASVGSFPPKQLVSPKMPGGLWLGCTLHTHLEQKKKKWAVYHWLPARHPSHTQTSHP